MEESDTSSISKGCFAIPGNGNGSLEPHDYLNNKPNASQRLKIALDMWKEISAQFKSLQQKLQENIFSELLSFISQVFKSSDEEKSEIPTAILTTGVNMPDHAEMFQELRKKIKDSVSPYIVILQASKCSSMKSLMRSVCDQLLEGSGQSCRDDDDTDDSLGSPSNEFNFLKKRSLPITISNIKEWYHKTCLVQRLSHSPRKKAKMTRADSPVQPIVVIFENLEGFTPKIVQDFVLMTSCHVTTLPIVFVFGVATSWIDVSQRLFPRSVIVNLSVRSFRSPPASSHLALILDEVLLTSKYPFKLSGRCMQLLLDVFLCHDFSITNFLHFLKFCILEHFDEKPCSVLCTCDHQAAALALSKLSKRQLEDFRQLPSVKKYLASSDSVKAKSSKKEANFRKSLLSLHRDFYSYQRKYFRVLRFLHALTSSLPQCPMGKQLREVYIACSKYDLLQYPGFSEAFTYLKVSSRDQLLERLRDGAKHLTGVDQSQPGDDVMSLSAARDRIQSAIEEFEKMADNNVSSDDSDDESDGDALETVKYAYQLQERLRNRQKLRKEKKLTKFEKLRRDTLDYLKPFFEHHLRRAQLVPLHEIHFFDSPSKIKRHLVAAPRLSIHTALSDPYQYLKVSSLENVLNGIIPANAPDVCVAYKLHNECGNFINLYDWMQAFRTIVASSKEEADIDDVTQARFVRAVSELQFLGFIRPTKKKTDHVQRLTWSHV